jgi:hypothetical protein
VSVLRHHFANQISSAGHVLLALVGARIGTKDGWLVVLALIVGLSLAFWVMNFRRSSAVGDTPTSRIASAPQGYVELAGVGRPFPGHRLVSPLSGTHCLWYYFLLEEKHGKDWRRVREDVSHDSFMVDDGTGEALVDPDFAEIVSTGKRRWVEGRARYTESLLVPAERLYVLGEFATVGGQNTQLDARADLNALLADWKADKAQLKRRFDLDGNGEIDVREWDLARKAARREVTKRHMEIRSQPGVHMMRKPRDGRHFVISNLDPDQLARRYRMWTTLQLAVAVLAGAGILFTLAGMARLARGCSLAFQERKHRRMLVVARDVGRGLSAIVAQRAVRTAREQPLHRLHLAVAGRPHQRGEVVPVARIYLDAAVEQQIHRLHVAPCRRVQQRRLVDLIDARRIGSGVEQRTHHLRMPGIGSRHQRSGLL